MRDIPGYEEFYAVTVDGRVFSKRQNRTLKTETKNWYSNVRLCKNGVRKAFKVHQIIALCFLPMVEGKNEINHKNGIKSDNRVENLEWINRSENIKHSYSVLKRVRTTGLNHPKYRPVLDFITGIYYESSTEAATAKGISRQNLLNGMKRNRLSISFV